MYVVLRQLDAADSIGPPRRPDAPARAVLAYISEYVAANRGWRAPADADLQSFFNLAPPSVKFDAAAAERCGFIRRVPGKARAIEVLVPAAHLPPTERPFKF